MSYEFGLHLKQCGIVSQLTPHGTPQCNGVSERRNRTLLDMVRSMMSLTDLPLSFWGYALETSAFTLNRAPSLPSLFPPPFSSPAIMEGGRPNWGRPQVGFDLLGVPPSCLSSPPTYIYVGRGAPRIHNINC